MVSGSLIFFAIVAFIVLVAVLKTAIVVPQKTAFIVERLGKYRTTLEAGFHVLMPFFDRIAYRHSLKEQAIDVPPQECITKDNIAVSVDGILYMQVMDPVKASYGIGNYLFATTQLAQTTMRSEMGKLDLDRSFEERTSINAAIVAAVDKASDPWGIKVTRYEIKNITPPRTIRDAMEKQMRAEREKGRAPGEDQPRRGRTPAGDRSLRGRAREAHQRGRGPRQGDPARRGGAGGRHREGGHGHQRRGRHPVRQHAARAAVPHAVRQPRQDEQHHDHPERPRQRGGRHQGVQLDREGNGRLTWKSFSTGCSSCCSSRRSRASS